MGYNYYVNIKKVVIVILLTLCLVGVVFAFFYYQKQEKIRKVATYDECTTVANSLKSYPPRCNTPDGRVFTQDVGNELDMIDEIMVTSPRPNDTVTSPIVIEGRARGSWFFEGSLTGELLDQNKKKIGTAKLVAEGEWMTDEFVQFHGKLEFKKPESGVATLIIHKENPSGLPENDKKLTIPLKF